LLPLFVLRALRQVGGSRSYKQAAAGTQTTAQAAAKTEAGPTVMVAIEQYFPSDQRIIIHDLAYSAPPSGARAFARAMWPMADQNSMVCATERAFTCLWTSIMCCKRYVDEVLIGSFAVIDAVVDLGAGVDTRACRLPSVAEISMSQVDQLANIKSKQDRLCVHFGRLLENVTLVGIRPRPRSTRPHLGLAGL
jgi:O-methyltransferase involved in polyketide biosynthesis